VTTTYADHPKSVGELRMAKTRMAADWAPRDALVDTLRLIDRGEAKVSSLIIIYSTEGEDALSPSIVSASPNPIWSAGLLMSGVHTLLGG